MTQSLLCFGDSNTYGTVPMRDAEHDERFGPGLRWTSVLAERLGTGWKVIEEGLPGRTTVHDDAIEGASRNGLSYLVPCLGSHRPLDMVILCLGTNDLKNRFALSPEDIRRGLEVLLSTITSSRAGPGAKAPRILVMAPVPVEEVGFLGEIFVGAAEKSRALGAKYRAAAQSFGAEFIDAGSLVQVSPVDGIHLEADAHRVLGEALARAVLGEHRA